MLVPAEHIFGALVNIVYAFCSCFVEVFVKLLEAYFRHTWILHLSY
jgi:hypothetical protein